MTLQTHYVIYRIKCYSLNKSGKISDLQQSNTTLETGWTTTWHPLYLVRASLHVYSCQRPLFFYHLSLIWSRDPATTINPVRDPVCTIPSHYYIAYVSSMAIPLSNTSIYHVRDPGIPLSYTSIYHVRDPGYTTYLCLNFYISCQRPRLYHCLKLHISCQKHWLYHCLTLLYIMSEALTLAQYNLRETLAIQLSDAAI